MRHILVKQWKTFVAGLSAVMFLHAGTLSAQTQGTGNRVFHVNHIPFKMVFVKGGDMHDRDHGVRHGIFPVADVTGNGRCRDLREG